MPISVVQKNAIENIINTITTTTGARKRHLSGMFMILVDRNDWPEYFEIIPEPRSINQVRDSLEKNRYKSALDVFTDLSLVFWNAIFYNEPDSQIVKDAETLKKILETEWRIKHAILPQPRSLSPPPSSAQKVHKSVGTASGTTSLAASTAAAPTPVPPTSQPASMPARSVQPTPTPVPPTTTSSNSNSTTTKPAPNTTTRRQATPDVDVDIMSPEPEGQGFQSYGQNYDGAAGSGEMERDAESDEIVKQLEKSLPKWPGFGEEGWMEHGNETLYADIVHTMKSYKNIIGNRLAVALESVPDVLDGLTLPSPAGISLKIIETRVRAQEYTTPKSFDKDVSLLFLKARRWHEIGSEPYGCVLTLQRLYHALTSVNPPPPPGPPYSSTTNFASIRAGPGNVKPVHGQEEGVPGVTSHRVLTRDRRFVDEVHYKGWTVKLADWLHLSNPDDPSRPIIAQVFRCWVSEEESKRGQVGVTVSWYYRPEQTYHPANRIFWEGEVFKTSHFADHPLPDIIEKIACQFTARHIRGRPRPPYWWPGFPLYVCDSRYNDRDRVFVRIKNWNSCIPEEVRKSEEFMPIYPFERTVFPSRFPSPFVGKGGTGKAAVTSGPGGITEATDQGDVDIGGGGGEGSRRGRKSGGNGETGQSKGVYVGNVTAGAGSVGVNSSHTVGMTSYGALQLQPIYSGVGLSGGGVGTVAQSSTMATTKPTIDRSVVTAAGGAANVQVEKLPPETTRHFDREPDTNEVLWFASPPVNVARAPTPRHSLAYLHFLAMKRKREADGGNEGAKEDDGDQSSDSTSKRRRNTVPPTVTELLASVQTEVSSR